jgi:hypothetical protein
MKSIVTSTALTLPFIVLHIWLFELGLFTLFFGLGFYCILFFGMTKWFQENHQQIIDQQMYYFMQMFLTTLAIKKTIHESFLDVYQRYQIAKQTWLVAYGSNDPLIVLENLQQRFHHPLYALFVATLQFYETQGGDVLTLFESLLTQLRLVETRRMESQQLKKRYFSQWIILWLLNLFVLIMAKSVLMDLFTTMRTSFVFMMMLTAVLIYVPISFYRWITTYLDHRKTVK